MKLSGIVDINKRIVLPIYACVNRMKIPLAKPGQKASNNLCLRMFFIPFSYKLQVTKLQGHIARVGALAWNGDMLSSGSRDRHIRQRDTRTPRKFIFTMDSHTGSKENNLESLE